MTTRNLQVVVKAVDQASATVKGIASRTITSFRSMMSVAADTTLAVGGLVRVMRSVQDFVANNEAANELDKIGKASRRLGISVETLSELRYAAKLGNVEFDSLAKSAAKFQQSLGSLNFGGNRAVEDTLDRLKVRARDSWGQLRNLGDVLPEVVDKISDLGAAERIAAARQLFGREGDSILEIAQNGRKGLIQYAEEAARTGVVFTRRMTDAAEEYNDSITRIGEAWLGVKANILTEVTPVVTRFLNDTADRIAQLPTTARGLIQLFKDWQAGGELGDVAKSSVTELFEASMDVVETRFVATARTAGTVFIETLNVGIQAIGPTISDTFRDALGPMLNELPGVDIELSLAGKAAAWRKELGPLLEQRNRVLNYARPDNPPAIRESTPNYRESILAQIEEQIDKVNKKIGANFKSYDDLEAALAAQARARTNSARRAISDAYDRVVESYSESAPDVARAMKRWDNALGMVGSAAHATQSTYDYQPWVRLFKSIRDGIPTLESFRNLYAVTLNESAKQMKEFEARRLSVFGDERGAQRIRLLATQAEERGKTFDLFKPQLREVQRLELRRFDVETQASEVLDDLTEAREKYSATLARNSQLVESGTLKQFQATQQNIAAAESVRELAQSVRGQIETIVTANPDLAKFLQRYRDDVDRILGELPVRRTVVPGFGTGVAESIDELVDKSQDFRAQGSEAFNFVADVGINRFSSAITAAKFNFSDFAQSAARDLAELTTRMLLLRAVGGAFKAFGFGSGTFDTAAAAGAVPGPPGFAGVQFNRGGTLPRFADGGTMARLLLGPNVNRDVGLYAGTPGELVISRNQVRANGGHANVIGRLNRGEYGSAAAAPSQQIFNVTIQVQASPGTTPSQARQSGKHAAAGFLDEVERSPTLRARFRGVVQA